MGFRLFVRWRFHISRLAVAVAGFAPIAALCFSTFGLASFSLATVLLVPPAIAVLAAVAWAEPWYRSATVRGFAFGLVAVTAYDAFRLPFIATGVWHDFIPRIGMWLLGDGHLHPFVGYLYRYLGDGGGMGLAFGVFYPLLRVGRAAGVAVGIAYGIAIWGCLIGTLVLAPSAQSMMFSLTPLTIALSLGGHVVYGGALGILNVAWPQPAPVTTAYATPHPAGAAA